MLNDKFNASGFYAALDIHRQARGWTWKRVAAATGVSASTLTRMKQGKRPDVDGLAALAIWSGVEVRAYYKSIFPNQPIPLKFYEQETRGLSDHSVKVNFCEDMFIWWQVIGSNPLNVGGWTVFADDHCGYILQVTICRESFDFDCPTCDADWFEVVAKIVPVIRTSLVG